MTTNQTPIDRWGTALANYFTHQHRERDNNNIRRVVVQAEPATSAHVVIPLAEFYTLSRNHLRGLQ